MNMQVITGIKGDCIAKTTTQYMACLCCAGRLMRTILYSTEHVSANNWETALFILFLMFFAVAASAYVLYHGLQVSTGLPVCSLYDH